MKKVVCFKDEDEEFDDEENMPTVKQVCCWGLLRSRKRAQIFHTNIETLEAFERSKYQNFVAILLSLNYILLYAVAIAPFVLIFGGKETEEIDGVEQSSCDPLVDGSQDPECMTVEDEFIQVFNDIMLIANGGLLAYTLICEVLILAI